VRAITPLARGEYLVGTQLLGSPTLPWPRRRSACEVKHPK